MTSLLFVNNCICSSKYESIVNGHTLSLLSWDRTVNPDLIRPHDIGAVTSSNLSIFVIHNAYTYEKSKKWINFELYGLETDQRSNELSTNYDRANTDSETIQKHMENILKKKDTLLQLDNPILEEISAEETEQEILDSDEYNSNLELENLELQQIFNLNTDCNHQIPHGESNLNCQTMHNSERGMNPVAMAVINTWKE